MIFYYRKVRIDLATGAGKDRGGGGFGDRYRFIIFYFYIYIKKILEYVFSFLNITSELIKTKWVLWYSKICKVMCLKTL